MRNNRLGMSVLEIMIGVFLFVIIVISISVFVRQTALFITMGKQENLANTSIEDIRSKIRTLSLHSSLQVRPSAPASFSWAYSFKDPIVRYPVQKTFDIVTFSYVDHQISSAGTTTSSGTVAIAIVDKATRKPLVDDSVSGGYFAMQEIDPSKSLSSHEFKDYVNTQLNVTSLSYVPIGNGLVRMDLSYDDNGLSDTGSTLPWLGVAGFTWATFFLQKIDSP